MAAYFESFGLRELAAAPEDAFRLASLAMAEGQRIPGYGGDYFRMYLGDAQVFVRTAREDGEDQLLGMDTHAAGDCLWDCIVDKDVTPPEADPMSRRVLVRGEAGPDRAVVDVVCAGVLPDIEPGDRLRLNMAGFCLRAAYSLGECQPVVEAQEDTVLLQGVVRDARVGETYLGMEPLTKFLLVTAGTPLGDVTLCHPLELVAEDQRDLVKPGAVVSAHCVLSGSAAAGAYAGGIVYGEAQNLALLRTVFRGGDVQRLRPALHSECACTFLENRQEGAENALELLSLVARQMGEAGFDRCAYGRVTVAEGEDAPRWKGRRCLLLGGEAGWAFLCLAEPDSLGRIREVVITNDSRLDVEPG